MSEKSIKVNLLGMTPNALELIYAASRQCYSKKSAKELFSSTTPYSKKEEFVRKIVASGHESPLEHINFTFSIEGISRVCSHQLVRHRIASYSQQSQRYVKEGELDYIIPPQIKNNPSLHQLFLKYLNEAYRGYKNLIEELEKIGIKGEKANQDARFLLPQATETKIVVTMNARELLHFFRLRCCQRAQWEIRKLAEEMLKILKKTLPAVFSEAGAKCQYLRYCPEPRELSCGRYPLKKEVINSNTQ